MYCRYCGETIRDDSSFCPFCGKQLVTDTIAPVKESGYQEPARKSLPSDEYYQREVKKLASSSLQSASKFCCYAALVVFLFFSLKMAPLYGTAQIVAYVIMAAFAIFLVTLFNKKVLPGNSKAAFTVVLWSSIFVIAASIGLRLLYESKVDAAEMDIPSSGKIYVQMTLNTHYFNSTGTGTIKNPSSHIKIGNDWHDSGASFEVMLNQKYDMRVGSGGSGSGGYIDTSITFKPSSFKEGRYVVEHDVRISGGPASLAEVTATFTRFCPFWDVIFY